jgi:hypothetical protein
LGCRQMRRTVALLTPCVAAIVRVLQWVACGGLVCSVARPPVGPWPRRSGADRPRLRGFLETGLSERQEPLAPQLDLGGETPNRCAIAWFGTLWAANWTNLGPFDDARRESPAESPHFQSCDLVSGEHNGGGVSAHADTIVEIRHKPICDALH